MSREFIGDHISIDRRMIEYSLVTAHDYLEAKNEWSEEEVTEYLDNHADAYTLINQIMALKQACYLLRRTSHSCGSLADDLYELKMKLVHELWEKDGIEFDDEFVENFRG